MMILQTIVFTSVIAVGVATGKLPLIINTWTFLNATTAGQFSPGSRLHGLIAYKDCPSENPVQVMFYVVITLRPFPFCTALLCSEFWPSLMGSKTVRRISTSAELSRVSPIFPCVWVCACTKRKSENITCEHLQICTTIETKLKPQKLL